MILYLFIYFHIFVEEMTKRRDFYKEKAENGLCFYLYTVSNNTFLF